LFENVIRKLKIFEYWVKGAEIGANAFHSDSISSLQFTALNLRAPNDLLLQEVYCCKLQLGT
jgi:hypothetical protein